MPEPNSGCWLWTGGLFPKTGYGAFNAGDHRVVTAHSFAYELYKGPVPAGLELDHKCRIRCCCNPDHLEPVTHRENMRRGSGWAGQNARKTHCPRGHALVPENIVAFRLKSKGQRTCLICWNEREAKRGHPPLKQ